MNHDEISQQTYNRTKIFLLEKVIENPEDEYAVEVYKEFSGDTDLKEVKYKKVLRELQTFLDSLEEQTEQYRDSKGYKMFSIDDFGADYDDFYIRFSSTNFEILAQNVKVINEYIQNVADRTNVTIAVDFSYYDKLKPNGKAENEKLVIPKMKSHSRMEVELNQDKSI